LTAANLILPAGPVEKGLKILERADLSLRRQPRVSRLESHARLRVQVGE
jgi:hypothetical protein